jgi:putative copper resistance protein D
LAEALVSLCRFLEYAGAMVLFGSPLLLIYGSPLPASAPVNELKWIRPLLGAAALTVLMATALGFIAQTSHLAGSLALAFQPEALKAALWDMDFGKSSIVRLGLALVAFIVTIFLRVGKKLWCISATLGGAICATFAWMGHGAATEGKYGIVHLAGDIAHTLAAAGWVGALVVFCGLVTTSVSSPTAQKALGTSLAQFSLAGSVFVAIIIGSGLINSAFLVGWDVPRIVSTRYGQVLIAKLVLFSLMLALALANRIRHTPALIEALTRGGDPAAALLRLRRSVTVETITAAAVIALVSWLGMLEPVTAQ